MELASARIEVSSIHEQQIVFEVSQQDTTVKCSKSFDDWAEFIEIIEKNLPNDVSKLEISMFDKPDENRMSMRVNNNVYFHSKNAKQLERRRKALINVFLSELLHSTDLSEEEHIRHIRSFFSLRSIPPSEPTMQELHHSFMEKKFEEEEEEDDAHGPSEILPLSYEEPLLLHSGQLYFYSRSRKRWIVKYVTLEKDSTLQSYVLSYKTSLQHTKSKSIPLHQISCVYYVNDKQADVHQVVNKDEPNSNNNTNTRFTLQQQQHPFVFVCQSLSKSKKLKKFKFSANSLDELLNWITIITIAMAI